MQGPAVTVVGAGVTGASVAYHLARKGARVTVLEASSGAAAGVTGRSFGWVGLSASAPSEDPDLFALRTRALRDYARLMDELGSSFSQSVRGAIVWGSTPGATQTLIDEHRAVGSELAALTAAQLAALEPRLVSPPDCAAFAEADFALESAALTNLLLDGAREAGATVHFGAAVERIETGDGKAVSVRTKSETFTSDWVVMANGTAAAKLAGDVGASLDIERSPATLLRIAVEKPLVGHILSGPDFEVRHAADGSLLVADWYPADGEAGLGALAAATLATLRDRFVVDGSMELQSVQAGFRPYPQGGWPCVGNLPAVEGVYVVVAHPGIILAPFLGRIAAEDIIDGRRDPAIEGLGSP